MQQFINKLALNPKRIFLIDGLGAFLTVLFLLIISRTLNEYVEMPKMILNILSVTASVFCIYSLYCFLFLSDKKLYPFLQAIIIANILYSCLTLGLVIYNYSRLTIVGVTYFLLETAVIFSLVFFEINVLTIHKDRRRTDF